ncbi:MAG: carbamoyl phosphate synthase large subunit [Noviherbaspirillum sp.]|nr:carbamoyl phosphate synthase large subunit [Noviherbaspirillum sp.]
MNSKTDVLLLSAGRRVELAQAFKAELNDRCVSSRLVATDMKPALSAACQVADLAIKAPRVSDPAYIDFLWDICDAENIGLVVPTIDTELQLLAQHRDAFAAHGVHIVISDESLVDICRDKRLTAGLFNQLDIETPRIYDRTAIEFPCFAKPYDGSCSVGATAVQHAAMLSDAMLADEKMMFMELIDRSHSEFTVDAYYNRTGRLISFVPRERIEVRGGEISKGITRRHYVYDYLLPALSILKGARGCITLQLFANAETGRFAALEINPRFGGGYPLSYSAGANYPGWLIDEYMLNKEIQFYDGWEADLMMLRYDAKVLVRHAA